MRHLFQQSNSGQLASRFDEWVLNILTRPPVTPTTRILLVSGCVIILAVVDYLSGPALSLQVFYLGPIALAFAWLGTFAAFITSVSSIIARVGGDYLLGAEYTRRPSIIWNSIGYLAIYLIVAWILQGFITLRRELEERVQSRTAALAEEIMARERLQLELVEISERERRAIGNDLHDGLSQHLTAMAFAAGVLTNQLTNGDKRAPDTARELVRLAEEGILQSRQLARGLLLTAIEPGNLNQELEELAASIQRQTGVRCHYQARNPPLVGDSGTASHLFRIAQEALRNSIKHAQPTALTLTLSRDHNAVVLSVSDNGPGLHVPTAKTAGFGLRVMEHRAKLIGGDFTLESIPGKGTFIRCRVPVRNDSGHSRIL